MAKDRTIGEEVAEMLQQAGVPERRTALQTSGLVSLTAAVLSLTEVTRAAAIAEVAMAKALQQGDA